MTNLPQSLEWAAGRRAFFACSLLLLLPGLVRAQRFPFFHLSVDDGLIQSQATCLAQDHKGNLWVGTLGGISRYDGTFFTSYTERNGLKSNYVWAVAADAQDNIWMGTSGFLSCFNGRTFRHFQLPGNDTFEESKFAQQIVCRNDSVFWMVSGSLYLVYLDKLQPYKLPGLDGQITTLNAGDRGLWVGADTLVLHVQSHTCDTFRCRLPGDGKAAKIISVFVQNDLSVWIATNKGIFLIHNQEVTPWNTLADVPATTLAPGCLTRDHRGALWLGTARGVLKVTDTTARVCDRHCGLSDNTFTDAFTDASGNVWLASDGQGVFRIWDTRFTVLDETTGLPSGQVTAIAQGQGDSIYFGTYDAGLACLANGKVSPVYFPSAPVPGITSLARIGGTLWIGTRGRGLWSYDGAIYHQFRPPEFSLPSSFITRLYLDPENRLWIGFLDGVSLMASDSFETLDVGHVAVNSFCSIGKDSVLIAADNGAFLYHDGVVHPFITHTGADSVKVLCYYASGDELWIGSSDYGLFRYGLKTHRVLAVNTNNGLRSDFIYDIIGDNEGNIWAGTGFGIHKITVSAEGSLLVSFFGKAQGVMGMESNGNAVLKTPGGDIWFGTTSGALHYVPQAVAVGQAPPNLVLTSVKLADQLAISREYYDSTDNWYDIPYGLRLPANRNGLTFTFRAISMNGAQQLLYRYRMDGLESPWSPWSPVTSVTYSALPPGRYVLHLQVMGADDTTHPELTYAFEIITPFQKSNWFRWSVLGACLLAGVALQSVAGRARQKRMKLLARLRAEEQAKIRLRTAEDFHDEVGNRLTRINLLANVLKNKIKPNDEGNRILEQIKDNTAQLYSGTQDILWSLKPANDNLYEILERIRHFGEDLLQDTEITFAFSAADDRWRRYRLPMDMSRNLIMIFKEALNNCVKYAQARHISIEATLKGRGVLQLVMKDDGLGFDIQSVQKGNGLNNMQVRANRLNGRLYVDSRPGKGTIISLTFKIPQAAQ